MKLTNANVKAMRDARGVSQRYFADHVGVSQGTVASWEAGRSPVPAWFEKHWGVILGKLDGELATDGSEEAILRKKIAAKLARERIESELRRELRQPKGSQRSRRQPAVAPLPDLTDHPGPDGLRRSERGRPWSKAMDGIDRTYWVWDEPEEGGQF